VCGPNVPLPSVGGNTCSRGLRGLVGMSGRDRMTKPQVAASLRQGSRSMEYQGRGFVSHLPGHRARASCARSERPPRAMSPRAGHRPLGGLSTQGVGVPPCRWPGTARLYRGMSLAQTPPGLPLARRLPGGLACRGQPVGSPCQARSATRGAPLPRKRDVPGPWLGPHPMGTGRYTAVTGGTPFGWSWMRSWGSGPGEGR
jgi:hypothetical protein